MNIKELAEQVGAELYADTIIVNGKDADDFVKRFAELVAVAEREACARLSDEHDDDVGMAISRAIRARSKHD